MITLTLVFKKIECEDKTKYDGFCSISKAEIIINDSDNVFQSIYTTVIINIQKSLRRLLIYSLIILLLFQSVIL